MQDGISTQRGWRLSASWGPNQGTPSNPRTSRHSVVLRDSRERPHYIDKRALRKIVFLFLSNWKVYDRLWKFSSMVMNQTWFRLAHNQKENCHYDHIPFNWKGKPFPRVWAARKKSDTKCEWRKLQSGFVWSPVAGKRVCFPSQNHPTGNKNSALRNIF